MHTLLPWLICALMLVSCGKKAHDVEPSEALGDVQFYEERAISFLEQGFVVAKGQDGSLRDQGDSLLFTGLLLGSLSCEKLEVILSSFERMQNRFGGFLVRIDPLPNEYAEGGNFISRDGATGALYGLVRAAKRCPAQQWRIASILNRWEDAVGSSLLLHPKSTAVITPSFRVFWRLAHGHSINDLEYQLAMASSLATTKIIKDNKSACYPMHLQTIQNLLFELRGRPLLAGDKKLWCELTDGMDLLLTDWYCERRKPEIDAWLKDPSRSPSVYMHQRCSWESPDGEGINSPRVDFLVLYRHVLEGSDPWQ